MMPLHIYTCARSLGRLRSQSSYQSSCIRFNSYTAKDTSVTKNVGAINNYKPSVLSGILNRAVPNSSPAVSKPIVSKPIVSKPIVSKQSPAVSASSDTSLTSLLSSLQKKPSTQSIPQTKTTTNSNSNKSFTSTLPKTSQSYQATAATVTSSKFSVSTSNASTSTALNGGKSSFYGSIFNNSNKNNASAAATVASSNSNATYSNRNNSSKFASSSSSSSSYKTSSLIDNIINRSSNNSSNRSNSSNSSGSFRLAPLNVRDAKAQASSKRMEEDSIPISNFDEVEHKLDRDHMKRQHYQQQQSRGPNNDNNSSNTYRNSKSKAVSTTNAADMIQQQVLGDMPAPLDLEDEFDIDDGPSAGELRYQQYQERMAKKKQTFLKKYSTDPQPAYIKTIDIEPIMSMPHESEYIDSSQPLDINEMKRKMADGIARKKAISARRSRDRASMNARNDTNESSTTTPAVIRTVVKDVIVPSNGLKLKDLASRLSMRVQELIVKLEQLGELDVKDVKNSKRTKVGKKSIKTDNLIELEEKVLDADLIELVVLELGLNVKRVASKDDADSHSPSSMMDKTTLDLTPRAPVVCVMGHVDHGKTTLLDTLRAANVADGEAGGITQKLSAFTVAMNGRKVVFLDTPGHAAFNTMRANGAAATDLVILVVAIDDGVRPQTKEAIQLAKASGCTIIIALNKIDKLPVQDRKAARSRVLAQIVDCDLVPEDYGGDCIVVEVAGKSGEGINTLIDSILLQSDVLELQALATGHAEAIVLDAVMEKGRGVVADMLIRWGRLSIGDSIVVGTTCGKVKALFDDKGNNIEYATPSTPVRLIGLNDVPTSGQELISVVNERKAQMIADRRQRIKDLKAMAAQALHVKPKKVKKTVEDGLPEEVDDTVNDSKANELFINVILKADGVGTLEALQNVVTGLTARTTDIKVNIMGASVGNIVASDVERAATMTNTVILGFNIGIADSDTRSYAKELDIPIVNDTVIYRLEDALRSKMEEHMPDERVLVSEGTAKVQQVFNLKDKTNTQVGGLMVSSGYMRNSGDKYIYRVKRNGVIIIEDVKIEMLKRFKDTVHEVQQGNDCGIVLEKFKDFKEHDEVECLKVEFHKKIFNITTY